MHFGAVPSGTEKYVHLLHILCPGEWNCTSKMAFSLGTKMISSLISPYTPSHPEEAARPNLVGEKTAKPCSSHSYLLLHAAQQLFAKGFDVTIVVGKGSWRLRTGSGTGSASFPSVALPLGLKLIQTGHV